MKKCSKCLEIKDENEFYKSSKFRKDGTQGFRSICKFCANKNSLEQNKKNPEKNRKSSLNFYYRNSESIKSKKRENWKNIDENERKKISDSKKIYREKNREILQEKRKQKYDPNIQSQKWKEYYYKNRENEIIRKEIYYKSLDEEGKKSVRKHVRNWQKRNPEKVIAHRKVYCEIKKGNLIRPKICSSCSEICNPQAHHEDYSKPLDIIWLCKNCHAKIHRKFN